MSILPRVLTVFLLTGACAVGVVASGGAASAVDDPVLVDRAAAAGISQSTRSWSTAAGDFNNDGYEDFIAEFHQYTDSWVYGNDGDGTFTRAFKIARTNSQGGVLDRHDCQWYDVDGNGLLDFYCSGGRNQSNYVKTANKDNELWLQLTPGQFTDRGTEWGVGDACGRGRMVAWIDVNNDGWKDLFVGNQVERNVTDPCDNPANGYLPEDAKIWLNNAGQGLTYSAQWSAFKTNIGVRCAVPIDYNRDGRMDLVSCSFRNNRATLYRNTGSGWQDMTTTISLGNLADAAAVDLDGDGIQDLVTADVNGATYRRGTGTGFAAAVRLYQTPSNADGFDLAIGDIQGDGLQDIYLVTDSTNTSTNPTDRLLVNHGSFSFVALTPPGAGGMGDSVAAVDVNGTGKDQFVVLNGADSAVGPVQLIAAAP
jgi:hypothetical protein